MSTPSLSSSPKVPVSPGKPMAETRVAAAPVDSGTVPPWRSGLLLLLTLIITLAYAYDPPMNIQSIGGVVMKLPPIVGDFFGKDGNATAVERDILPADTEFARRFYADTHGHQIECSVVLSGAEQRSIHRPEGCLTGQGWTIVGQQTIPIPLQSGHTLMARKLNLERLDVDYNNRPISVRAMYVYWFVGQHTTTASEIQRVLLSNWDRVIHNRAHRWAYVSLFSLITDNLRQNGLTTAQTEEAITGFTKQVVPKFQIDEMPPQAGN